MIALVIGFVMFSLSGAAVRQGSGVIWLVPGFVALIAGIILVAPFFLALLARVGRRSPLAMRLALRDLSRYRARSGSALSAISVGVLIAVIVCAVAVARYSNVFDYVGPNLASNELVVCSPSSRLRLGTDRPQRDGAGDAEHPVAGGRRPHHRLLRRRHGRRRTGQSGGVGRPAEPQRIGPAVERRRSTWRRRRCCGPTASTRRPSRPTSTSSAHAPGSRARACS